jgi:DNA-binding transcriptional LysR family regulator
MSDVLTTRIDARLRTRPIGVGYLRALEAVARHLNFRLAAEELSLTQSAVSRQIQALEDEVGLPLFLRKTRSVELTQAGRQLLHGATSALEHIDSAVRLVRRSAGRRSVALSTSASFASMWLLPRLEGFQAAHPDIDIRIDATDALVNLDTSDADLAIRYTRSGNVAPTALRLFGEQLAPVASPWLLQGGPPLRQPADLAGFALLESAHPEPHFGFLSWRSWLGSRQLAGLEPKRWISFNYAYQIAQAALAGQGIALARMPLVASSLASGDLVEVLPGSRVDTPNAHWLLLGPRAQGRAELQAFCDWLLAEAGHTRTAIGESA